jgi:hypothetical protein
MLLVVKTASLDTVARARVREGGCVPAERISSVTLFFRRELRPDRKPHLQHAENHQHAEMFSAFTGLTIDGKGTMAPTTPLACAVAVFRVQASLIGTLLAQPTSLVGESSFRPRQLKVSPQATNRRFAQPLIPGEMTRPAYEHQSRSAILFPGARIRETTEPFLFIQKISGSLSLGDWSGNLRVQLQGAGTTPRARSSILDFETCVLLGTGVYAPAVSLAPRWYDTDDAYLSTRPGVVSRY